MRETKLYSVAAWIGNGPAMAFSVVKAQHAQEALQLALTIFKFNGSEEGLNVRMEVVLC